LIAFLQYLEEERGNCVRTRNLRLAALRSFFRYVGACEGPEMIAQTQRIMAIPLKRFARPLLGYLSHNEMQALLQAMDNSRSGRRDHLLFLFLYNTGARVSEALSVRVQDVQRHDYRAVQLLGKGRKHRTVPLWKETVLHIRAWLKLAGLKSDRPLLPNRFGRPMTRIAVQTLVTLANRTTRCGGPWWDQGDDPSTVGWGDRGSQSGSARFVGVPACECHHQFSRHFGGIYIAGLKTSAIRKRYCNSSRRV
jgi:integrase/recombinase XerD